jgi:hypothetical protein
MRPDESEFEFSLSLLSTLLKCDDSDESSAVVDLNIPEFVKASSSDVKLEDVNTEKIITVCKVTPSMLQSD